MKILIIETKCVICIVRVGFLHVDGGECWTMGKVPEVKNT